MTADTFVTFDVLGEPRAQGNHTAFISKSTGRPIITEGGTAIARKRHKEWRQLVKVAARAAADLHGTFTGPVVVACHFRNEPIAGEPDRHFKATSPDLDKLCRSVLDSLTDGLLLKDDALVVELRATKRYCLHGEQPGVRIIVDDLTDSESDYREMRRESRQNRIRNAIQSVTSKGTP